MHTEPVGALVRAFLDDGAVRLILVEATAPAAETRRLHALGPHAARLGAESLVAAALNAAHVKDQEQLSFQVRGESPTCSAYADVTAEGTVRARIEPADLELEGGRLKGMLVAIKSLGTKELYRGVTEVAGTTLEEALASHLGASNQVDDILRIGVKQGPDGEILQAGGLLLERMPVERDQPSLDHEAFHERYDWLRQADVLQVLTQLAFGRLGDRALHVLEQRPLVWRCRCSRGRIEATLSALDPDTLLEMAEEDHGAEVSCHFCNQTYRLEEGEIRALRAKLLDVARDPDPATDR